MDVFLPEKVEEKEDLSRVVCASSKRKNYSRIAFKEIESEKGTKYQVQTPVFLDNRNPSVISVNRTSTLTGEEAHQLGLEHQQVRQPDLTYHGYARIKARLCFDHKCQVKKDDVGGTQPYHANVIYPRKQSKEDDMEVAIELAYKAEFIRYQKD